jgi:hypothetical protein
VGAAAFVVAGAGVAVEDRAGCAQGRPNTAVAAELGCDRVTVAKWRHRFAADRLEGLVDAPRGRGAHDR